MSALGRKGGREGGRVGGVRVFEYSRPGRERSRLIRHAFLPPALPLSPPSLPPSLPPHRVRLVEPVKMTPISPYL